jgi:hypothetical protein
MIYNSLNKTSMKKLTISFSLILLLICLGLNASFAQEKSVGLALKASTMGFGGDAVFRFHEKMTARIGYDAFTFNYPISINQSDIEFAADLKLKTGSITALYDYYLLKSLFVTAGIAVNNFGIYATGAAENGMKYGDITIPKEKVGSFDITVRPSMKISPYLGIGFGKTLGEKLGFAFELGTFYQGSPDLTIITDGLIAPTSNPDLGQEQVLENQFSQYYLYPVLKLSLSYNIFSF